MKISSLWRLVLAGWVASSMGAMAQHVLPWQSSDASGAGRADDLSHFLFTSTGQSATGVSGGATRILYSGFLHIRLVPSGEATIVAQSSVDFGDVIVGRSALRTLTVQNAGAVPLHISGSSIAPSVYAINAGGGARTLAPGGSVEMQLQFLPSATGTVTGTLTISSDAANDPSLTVALSGTGVATAQPRVAFSRTLVDFGTVPVGTGHKDEDIQVRNIGTGDLVIASQTIGGADAMHFSIVQPAGTPIAAGAESLLRVRCQPASEGSKAAVLRLATNDPGLPVAEVSLLSRGVLDVERLPGAPAGITLYQNFPNPFNPSTTIVYDLDRGADVSLEVYDSNGRLLRRLLRQWQERGVYRADFTAPTAASGMLTAVLLVRSGGGTVARRISMMLVK